MNQFLAPSTLLIPPTLQTHPSIILHEQPATFSPSPFDVSYTLYADI